MCVVSKVHLLRLVQNWALELQREIGIVLYGILIFKNCTKISFSPVLSMDLHPQYIGYDT